MPQYALTGFNHAGPLHENHLKRDILFGRPPGVRIIGHIFSGQIQGINLLKDRGRDDIQIFRGMGYQPTSGGAGRIIFRIPAGEHLDAFFQAQGFDLVRPGVKQVRACSSKEEIRWPVFL